MTDTTEALPPLHSDGYWEERMKTIQAECGAPDTPEVWHALWRVRDELERWAIGYARAALAQRQQVPEGLGRLIAALGSVQCACSVKERDSGHRVGCWQPELQDALSTLTAAEPPETQHVHETNTAEGPVGDSRPQVQQSPQTQAVCRADADASDAPPHTASPRSSDEAAPVGDALQPGAAVLNAAPSAQAEPVADTKFCWLVELFDGDGSLNSAGWYHTGFVDIGGHSRATKNPHEARRYPTREQAEHVAEKLGTTLTGTWKAVEHGFAALTAAPSAQAEPVRQLHSFSSIDCEKLIAATVPGGSACDPQEVADSIRRYLNAWPSAQAEQQVPALKLARSLTDELMDCVDRLGSEASDVDPRVWDHLRVYMPPAAQAEPQVPLTDEQIDAIVDSGGSKAGPASVWSAYDFARAIERAHGIGKQESK